MIVDMQRICFGGSFNPVHMAHLLCCAAAARMLGVERVVLIPNRQPNLKDANDLAPTAQRVDMLKLAIQSWDAGEPQRWYQIHQMSNPIQPYLDFSDLSFELSDIELSRLGNSYTIDTAKQLIAQGWKHIRWLIGADQLLNLHRWHEIDALIQAVDFIIMHRPGYVIDWSKVDEKLRYLAKNVVIVPQLNISSTDVRLRIHQGLDTSDQLPANVREYINRNHIYV